MFEIKTTKLLYNVIYELTDVTKEIAAEPSPMIFKIGNSIDFEIINFSKIDHKHYFYFRVTRVDHLTTDQNPFLMQILGPDKKYVDVTIGTIILLPLEALESSEVFILHESWWNVDNLIAGAEYSAIINNTKIQGTYLGTYITGGDGPSILPLYPLSVMYINDMFTHPFNPIWKPEEEM